MTQTRFTLTVPIKDVIHRHSRHCVSGFGDSAVWEERSLGWFVHFDGSHELLYFGDERPEFEKGDLVKITFEKVNQ